MSEPFILIPGRTSDQGCGISEGKFESRYRAALQAVQMNSADAERLGIAPGQQVRLRNGRKEISLPVTIVGEDELPCGVLFMAYGEYSSRLMDGETHGSGMPTSKGIDVELTAVPGSNGSDQEVSR